MSQPNSLVSWYVQSPVDGDSVASCIVNASEITKAVRALMSISTVQEILVSTTPEGSDYCSESKFYRDYNLWAQSWDLYPEGWCRDFYHFKV